MAFLLQIWETLLGSSLAFVLACGSSTSCLSRLWPLLLSARSRKRARSSLSATASDPPAFLHLVVPEVRDRPHFLLRPVPGSTSRLRL